MSDPSDEGIRSKDDKYIVVARRYRPLQFSQLVGQETVSKALINAIETGRVGHAYLFTGARGVGKTSTARIFAKALNAPEGATATPSNDSDICQAIDAGEDVDVLEIDGASNRGIDEIRQLRAGVGMRPSRSRYKIYIIDEVHMLTQQAFNALLKTLEEPPEHVKFIFCTTDPEKIPITVLSRCQRFDFAPVETDAILERLQEIVSAEGAEADAEALRLLARRAAGSMRDSQSLLEQVLSFATGRVTVDQVHSMLGTADDARLAEMADLLIARDSATVLKMVDGAVMAGIDSGQFAEQLLGYFRDLMTATVGCGVEMLRHAAPSSYEELASRGNQLGIQTILAIVGIIDQTISRMRQSVHSRVLLEAALVQICQLSDLQAIADVAAGLRDGAPSGTIKSASQKKKDEQPALTTSRDLAVSRQATGKSSVHDHANPNGSNQPLPARTRQDRSPEFIKSPGSEAPGPRQQSATDRDANPHSPPSTEITTKPPPATVETAKLRWDDAHVRSVWRKAIEELDDMTANYARNAERVEPAGDGCIRVVFPGDRQLDKVSCEKPERRSKLEAALANSAYRRVHYECVLAKAAAPPKPQRRAITSADRAKRLREIEQEPIVKEMIDLFDAEVLRIDATKE